MGALARLEYEALELVPIDHGFCLPEALEPPYFEWLYWGQVRTHRWKCLEAWVSEELHMMHGLSGSRSSCLNRPRKPLLMFVVTYSVIYALGGGCRR